jgi:hypothetical protein
VPVEPVFTVGGFDFLHVEENGALLKLLLEETWRASEEG